MKNVLIKGVWYTEREAKLKGLLPKKDKKKSLNKSFTEKVKDTSIKK